MSKVTFTEVAKLTGLHRNTLRNWREAGRLHSAEKVIEGGIEKWVVELAEVEQLQANQLNHYAARSANGVSQPYNQPETNTSQPPLIRPDQQATIELVTQVQKPLLEMINKLQNRVAELERELGSVYGLLERASSPSLEPPPEPEEPPPPVPESKKRHWWQL